MNHRTRVLLAVAVTVLLFLTVQLGALALIEPFDASDRQAVENPDDPTNSAIYFLVLLVATGAMLAAFRYDAQWVIRVLLIGVSGLLAWFVLSEFVPPILAVGSVNVLAAAGAAAVAGALAVYPEWYVIDLAGVLIGAGAAALFGISFGLLPAIVFLAGLAIYDAISVYRTGHMLDLAEGAMDLKVPVVFVVPTTLSYSYLTDEASLDDGGPSDSSGASEPATDGDGVDAEPLEPDADPFEPDGNPKSGDEDLEFGGGGTGSEDGGAEPDDEREALFIGLGDAVIPTILVASAAHFLDAGAIAVPGITLTVPALGALLGTIAGLLALMHVVLQGRPHAGLPLLNGGAIGGYLLGAVASGVSIATALGL